MKLTMLEYMNQHNFVGVADIVLEELMDHAKFLSQAPELKHFVRVGENGEILQRPNGFVKPPIKPIYESQNDATTGGVFLAALGESYWIIACEAWEKAGEQILFEDCEIDMTKAHTPITLNGVDIGWKINSEPKYLFEHATIEEIIIATK